MRRNRVRGVPPKDAPAGTPLAKIWETLEARLDEQSEEIEVLMKAAGLERVSAQATERSKMMDYFEKTKKECDRCLAGMDEVTSRNGIMLKERTAAIAATLEKVRDESREALKEAHAVKESLKKDKADIQKALKDLKGLDAKVTECFKDAMKRVDALQAELEDTATKDAQDLYNLILRVKDLEKRCHVKNLQSRQNLLKKVESIGGQVTDIGGRVTLLAQNVASQEVAEQADGGDQSGGLKEEVNVCQKAAALTRTRCKSLPPPERPGFGPHCGPG